MASLVLGPALAVAASLPALRRALRRPVAETLAGAGTGGYGSGWLDRLVARSGLLSGTRVPGSVRMGVRNALRQKRRSAAAIAQVAVAAGLAIAFLALGQSITAVISQTIGKLHFSIGAGVASSQRRAAVRQPGARRRRRDTRRHRSRARRDEFRAVQRADLRGVGPGHPPPLRLPAERGPLVHHRRDRRGRPPGRPAGGARPRRRAHHRRQGRPDPHPRPWPRDPPGSASSGSTPASTNNGDTVYFPLPVLERLDGGPGTADSIWLTTASSAHAAIDRATTAVANRLAAAGYPVSTTEIYVTEAQITAADTAILTIVEILGLVVVAIMLMGLVSALSMGVIERTREVGILRCVGARARHIRRVFSAEAVVLAVVGWVFGVLLGWLIYQGLLALLPARCRPQPSAGLPAGHPADHARRRPRAHAHRHPRAAAPRHPDPARHGPPVPVNPRCECVATTTVRTLGAYRTDVMCLLLWPGAQRSSWMRTRLPAGSRKAQSRIPYGCSVGSWTTSAPSACTLSKVPLRSAVASRIQP